MYSCFFGMLRLKRTQLAMGQRWPGHYFNCQFEKRLPHPEIKCTRRIHLEIRWISCLVFHWILCLSLKTSFWVYFYSSYYIILWYSVNNSDILTALKSGVLSRKSKRLNFFLLVSRQSHNIHTISSVSVLDLFGGILRSLSTYHFLDISTCAWGGFSVDFVGIVREYFIV